MSAQRLAQATAVQAPSRLEVNTRADIARLASQSTRRPRGLVCRRSATIADVRPGARCAQFRHWPAFLSEALRQAALIATGSVARDPRDRVPRRRLAAASSRSSLARAFGTRPIAAGFSSWCTLREVVPFVFGYILAAKVGCGIVAELGAMRVNEEVDALEAMGVRSLAHLVSSRLLACAIVLPFTYLLAIGSSYLAAYLMSAKRFGDVSGGTWSLFFYLFQDPIDLVYSVVKGLVIIGLRDRRPRSTTATRSAAGRARSGSRRRGRWRSTSWPSR